MQAISQRLGRLQSELLDVPVAPYAPIELASVRARRHELDLAISQEEHAVEEGHPRKIRSRRDRRRQSGDH